MDGDVPDRVPVVPKIWVDLASRLLGTELTEVVTDPLTALRVIAERAQEKETGARGLRSIVEDIMLDIMFDLPDQEPGMKYRVTEDIVCGREQFFPLAEPKNKSA